MVNLYVIVTATGEFEVKAPTRERAIEKYAKRRADERTSPSGWGGYDVDYDRRMIKNTKATKNEVEDVRLVAENVSSDEEDNVGGSLGFFPHRYVYGGIDREE